MKIHTQGDRVYNLSGHEGEYVGKIENGPYLVRPILECYNEDRSYTDLGHLQEWTEIFDRAPVELIDGRISMKEAQLAEIQAKLDERQKEIRDTEQQYRVRLELLKKHESLQLLEDFMEGRITHYVLKSEYGGKPSIMEVTKSVPTDRDDHDARYYKRIKLLAFTGKLHGDQAQWTLSSHSKYFWDSSERVHLCRSYEEALVVIGKLCSDAWDELRSSDHPSPSSWIEIATKYGIAIPEDILTLKKEFALKSANEQIARFLKELEQRQAEYNKLLEA